MPRTSPTFSTLSLPPPLPTHLSSSIIIIIITHLPVHIIREDQGGTLHNLLCRRHRVGAVTHDGLNGLASCTAQAAGGHLKANNHVH